MRRRDFLKTAMAATVMAAVLPLEAKETPLASNEHFADVNGQHVFYSVHGTGKPLILLHGGINPDCFGGNLAELAKHRQVITPHLQGHGRTPDTARPLRCESLADDMAALIGHLKLDKADVMGYSLGGSVAQQIAIRHPQVVDRLVIVSAVMKQDGFYPDVVKAFQQMEANAPNVGPGVKASPLGKAYPDVDWTNLFRKTGEMTAHPFDWSADVARIKARTLLVYADADAVRPEHMVEFWKALGGGQHDAGVDGSQRPSNELAIVPGTTHYTLPVEPMMAEMVGRFLG
ncbi:alpha/beta fold hydrolase [Luteibacter aegosomatissinici]|uniref:alpha/beta fold hydrolase n=1 Tax=Luteibacter aegosomatissinici TaxID=2911539 RepID=UPI001FF7D96F|nr:alpha/beta hydrolase [Luteibacter aegosomatissinici]UPG93864.1 alpha/beta hydrolase [Luteibacter aegosomatissinici]